MNRRAKNIGIVTCVTLLICAGFADLLKVALDLVIAGIIADTIISIVFFWPLSFWLFLTGRLSNNKNMVYSLIASTVIGLIPVINILPVCIFEVVMIIILNDIDKILAVAGTVIPAAEKVMSAASTGLAVAGGAATVVAPEARAAIASAKKGVDESKKGLKDKSEKINELKKQRAASEGPTPVDLSAQNYTNGVANDVLVLKKKQNLDENTLDLQNRMQESANTGTNTPQNNGTGQTLDEINNKHYKSRTTEESKLLSKAKRIMDSRSIDQKDMSNPVLKEAWDMVLNGILAYNGTWRTRNGYRFNLGISAGGAPSDEMMKNMTPAARKDIERIYNPNSTEDIEFSKKQTEEGWLGMRTLKK